MAIFVSTLIPLFMLWLWGPLRRLTRRQRLVGWAVGSLVGGIPALLLWMLQHATVPYAALARWQPVGGWILACLLVLLPCLLLRDGLWLLLRLLGRGPSARGLHGNTPTLIAAMLAAALASWGTYQALQPPQVHAHTLALPGLPAQLDGLRLAVLADLHASPIHNQTYVDTVVQRTLAAQPDLIVLPGDLVDGDVATSASFVAPLARLQAPLGVWVAPGNHEYYSGYDAWMAQFQQLGLKLLANQTALLDVGGARLALSGIGDPVYGRTSPHNRDPAQPEGVPPDVAQVAKLARQGQAQFHLLLAHQPRFARDNAAHGIDLQISGHTHGGQVLGMDRLLVAPANAGFVRGLYRLGDMRLLVVNGAGLWAGFAVRLGVPARIDVITLRRE